MKRLIGLGVDNSIINLQDLALKESSTTAGGSANKGGGGQLWDPEDEEDEWGVFCLRLNRRKFLVASASVPKDANKFLASPGIREQSFFCAQKSTGRQPKSFPKRRCSNRLFFQVSHF